MAEQIDSQVPQIRFKGFEGEWNTCRLDEVATVERGKFSARPRNDPRYFGGNIPFVQTGDVVCANRLLRRYSQTLNEEGLAVSRSFPKNTILITIAANIGDLAITDFSVACPDSVVAINARDDFDTGFLYDFLGTKKGDLEAAATTAAQANINLKILKPLMVVVPTLDEQTQIGGYFRELDSLIGLHQRKQDKLVTLKKAMLQKMFPQPGATVPEIRFKGFEGDWVAKKLGDLIDLGSGRDYKHLSLGDIPVYGTGGYMLSVNEALSATTDAIGIGRKGTIDNPYILRAPFWTVDTLFYAIPRTENYLDFVYCVFQRIDWKQKDESTGVPSLSKVAINGVSVLSTNPPEQQKIGTYFRTLDSLISKHATQLQKLQQLKSACLEKMFV